MKLTMKIRLSKYIKTPLILLFLFMTLFSRGAYLLIPMDNTQQNHLKAYGIAYWVLKQDVEVSWLLNYRGGSFMFPYAQPFE